MIPSVCSLMILRSSCYFQMESKYLNGEHMIKVIISFYSFFFFKSKSGISCYIKFIYILYSIQNLCNLIRKIKFECLIFKNHSHHLLRENNLFRNIHYIERNGQEHYHQLSDFPQSICKKVTLLRYFRNYMNEHLLKAGATMAPREGDELARIPSLKTYFRTRSAIVLHLTNGTLQINFFEDHTKIILCPLMGAVTYIDKKRNFRTYRLEMIKKVSF